MQALATPSRLHILGRLHAGPCVRQRARRGGRDGALGGRRTSYGCLRHLGLVVGRREGRQVIYDLYDDHVGELLEQAIGHVEHLRQGVSRRAADADAEPAHA